MYKMPAPARLYDAVELALQLLLQTRPQLKHLDLHRMTFGEWWVQANLRVYWHGE